jgi:DNA topoisomerase-3
LKAIYEERFQGRENLTAIFQNFSKTEKIMFKPYPLNTIFLQKLCSDHLNFSSDKTMQIAEKLYNKGYISYPRTETNSFSKSINLFALISNLSQHITLGKEFEKKRPKKK